MRVKMKNTESGHYPGGFFDNDNFHCRLGHEYDIPDVLAKAWISQGIATPVGGVSRGTAPEPVVAEAPPAKAAGNGKKAADTTKTKAQGGD